MKTLLLSFGLMLSLCTSSPAAGHGGAGFRGGFGGHGGHWGGHGFGPGLALGFGLGALWSCPWWYSWDCSVAYPSYGYYYPGYSYSYSPAVVNASPVTPGASSTPVAVVPQTAKPPENKPWVPSVAGSGHWVPDPEPYNFAPSGQTTTKLTSQPTSSATISMTTSAGGVRVYANDAPGR